MKLIYISRKEIIFFYSGKIGDVKSTQSRYGSIYFDYIRIFIHKYCFSFEEVRAPRMLVNEKLQTVKCWLENQCCVFTTLDVLQMLLNMYWIY